MLLSACQPKSLQIVQNDRKLFLKIIICHSFGDMRTYVSKNVKISLFVPPNASFFPDLFAFFCKLPDSKSLKVEKSSIFVVNRKKSKNSSITNH